MSKNYYKSNAQKRPKNAQNGRFWGVLGRFWAFLGVLGRLMRVPHQEKKCDHYFWT
jgi:hypothetical protein